MKGRTVPCLVIVGILISAAAGTPAQEQAACFSVSVSKAIDLALANNPELEIARSRLRQAESELAAVKSAFWPSLSFYTEYTTGDAPSVYLFKTIDQRELLPNTDFNYPGSFDNFESGLAMDFNLYRGGTDTLRHKMSERGVAANRHALQATRNDLLAMVIKAYYQALAARDYVGIAGEAVDIVNAQLRDVRVRYEGGTVLKSEVLSLEARLARARTDLLGAENHFRTARAILANLLGIDVEEQPVLGDDGWCPPEQYSVYEEAVEAALARRPELAEIRQRLAAVRLAAEMARAGYLPSIEARAKAYYDDAELDYSEERGNWAATLVFNWALFSGFSTEASVEKAKAEVAELLAGERKIIQAIQLDVKRSVLRLAETRARLEVAKAGRLQAEEALKLVKKEYEGGSATVVRYLDAEHAYNSSRINETNSFYDLKQALADVCRATGCFGENAE